MRWSLLPVGLLAAQLAVWECFLVAARPWGLALPVSAAMAVVGNVLLGRWGMVWSGSRWGAVLPGAVWLTVALTLSTARSEGDRVVPDSNRGMLFLLAGTIAAAAVAGFAATPRTTGASPERVIGR
jgi:hypothetical protein